jgi:hypothetical protein
MLIPVDELERLCSENDDDRHESDGSRPRPGVRQVVAPDVVRRIRADRAAGKTLRQIAADLNAN